MKQISPRGAKLPPQYKPALYEQKIYSLWERAGAFKPKKAKKPFIIMMPPPNVTGTLHIGHALAMTLEDILTRYHRMQGEETLYLPGTDHAGIATQVVVEKDLRQKDIKKEDLGREKFVKKVWAWKEKYHERIVEQLRSIGVSADWNREAFTLDEPRSLAVNTAFAHLYKKGLIYRGLYLVNWCPNCGTAIADDEVEHQEVDARLYFLKYAQNFPIVIATTRPETKLGDTAVAVHPDDKRYQKYIGKQFEIKLDGLKRTIKIVADKTVDRKFGTGAVGVTPAHSADDWRIAKQHSLEIIKVIDEKGKMTTEAGKNYEGLKTLEARQKLVGYLKRKGLLKKITPIKHNLAVCYRCEKPIEPLPSLQWFVKIKPLAEKAIKAVESGKVKIIPKRFEKIYFHWLDNIRDWCISRQLWWGHRLPVYYRQPELKSQNSNLKTDNREIYVGTEPPKGKGWQQEEDVLDTWFSSALWPFSTLGWPDTKAADFKKYYPTDVLETGYDILFFWVARMVMLGIELTGKSPFHTVYLNGLVRDERGRKMSKSLGNIVEPIELIEQWGTDAVRMALVIGTAPGNDVNFSAGKAKGYRNFANKIWNAARFVLTRIDADNVTRIDADVKLSEEDKKDLGELQKLVRQVTKYLESYQFSQAGDALYHWLWHTFADVIIERNKQRLEAGGKEAKAASFVLSQILRTLLIMLHPFMPFVTETIWQELPKKVRGKEKLLISVHWPKS